MTSLCVFLIAFVGLFMTFVIGYACGERDGYKEGYNQGVEAKKLKAIAKLEYRIKAAKAMAQTAINTIPALEELENVTDKESAMIAKIVELENKIEELPKHVYISESAYSQLEAIDQNTVYYIYAND